MIHIGRICFLYCLLVASIVLDFQIIASEQASQPGGELPIFSTPTANTRESTSPADAVAPQTMEVAANIHAPAEITREMIKEVAGAYSVTPAAFRTRAEVSEKSSAKLNQSQGILLKSTDTLIALFQKVGLGEGTIKARSSLELRFSFLGANSNPELVGFPQLNSKVSYLLENNAEHWEKASVNFAKIVQRNVYPGIDVAYYGELQNPQHQFILSPGADPNLVKIAFEGQDRVEIDSAGNLVLHKKGSRLVLKKPIASQEIGNLPRSVDARYILDSVNTVRFQVGTYDVQRPLMIGH